MRNRNSSPQTYKYGLITRISSHIHRRSSKIHSYEHISQSFFRSLADVTIDSPSLLQNMDLRILNQAKVIYVKSDWLERFLVESKRKLTARLLLVGSSDFTINVDLDELLPHSVVCAYIQNSNISDNRRIYTLPIGTEDPGLGLNGLPHLMSPGRGEKVEKVLVGPFSPTHPERIMLCQQAQQSPVAIVRTRRCSPQRYSRYAKQFRWIACPQGNGIDTHRFWESLYRGCIPIVKKSHWSTSLKFYDIPMAELDQWNAESLTKLVNGPKFHFVPSQIPVLWKRYWLNRIKHIVV